MARTTLTVQTPVGPHPSGAPAPGDLHTSWTAADAANGNKFPHTGKELLCARNTHGANASTVTVDSVDDPYVRQSDITAYSLAAGEELALWMGDATGWKQTDGNIYLNVGGTGTIEFKILHIPQ